MTVPRSVLRRVIGCRPGGGSTPNFCDKDSKASVSIAMSILEELDLLKDHTGGPRVSDADAAGLATGTAFERELAALMRSELRLNQSVGLEVDHPGRPIATFEQYQHLEVLERLIAEDDTGTLGISIGRDYQVLPDITVSTVGVGGGPRFLHASVSCKLTIRSDRAQNVRLEAMVMNRHRRGRQPHIMAVTAEPLPTRIASLARGTGEIDAVYHVALPELLTGAESVGGEQEHVLNELVSQRRLRDWSDLVPELSSR